MLDFYSTPIVGTPVFLYSGQIAVPEPNIIGVTVSFVGILTLCEGPVESITC